jgi:hypothetical protein
MRDQRCLCREFIVFSCFYDETPSLTQISSIYKPLLASWLLCDEVNLPLVQLLILEIS